MTRCDYDAVFYRVFCVTLLAVAFTFTIILTCVFIDIDGLLASKKDKYNTHIIDDIIRDEFTSEATDNDDINYGENDESYRTKRSIETQNFLFHFKNPRVKNILANRLSSLLEELDAEETAVVKPKEKKNSKDIPKGVEVVETAKLSEAPPKVVIKTVIDITSDKIKENDTKISKENIKGVVELVYNGKTIKFSRPDAEMLQPTTQKQIPIVLKPKPTKPNKIVTETTVAKVTHDTVPKSYMDKFVEEFFKHFPHDTTEITNEIKEHFESRRLKRHIKIKYDSKNAEDKMKANKKKTEDDELYVEIETHFDSKGMKGEKKKKLIRSLIEKIQKAIHSDMEGKLIPADKDHVKNRRRIHFRKRLQDPLKHNNHVLLSKYSLPHSVVHRQLNPISKTVTMQESSPYIGSKYGEEWKKPCFGPGFLAANKAINSAEMSEVDINYSKVLDVNGIPQRLQLPLNSELSEETLNTNSYYDMGKMKFFIKDIDGSGFSVGFNQYVDEPPDSETMKLFTGLENVIKTYHQNYDSAVNAVSTTEVNLNPEESVFDTPLPNNEHIIERRSVTKKHDYHSNEYKVIYDNDFMPYNNYRDIFKKKSRRNIEYSSKKHFKELPLILDENIFEKNLKPAEIFSLANLFKRKKRSINVKKISNLKSKIKLNRYLNTKAMSTKRIFLNKKRNKRQINKIRIIATDLPHLSKHSNENLFVVSDENVFADRAIVKEVETSEGDHDKQEDSEYQLYQNDDIPATYVTKIFDGISRHNPLMAKYPHIFMEEISRSREEYIPNNALLFGKLPGLGKLNHNVRKLNHNSEKTDEKVDPEHNSTHNDTDTPRHLKEQEIVNALMVPPSSKANYKVTVKIVPKNQTGLNSGFKEIHTSINKRFNKNGLMYSSLVNVSEISKVTKLNTSNDRSDGENKGVESYLTKIIRDQQEKMQYLLKQHAKNIKEQLSRLNEEKTNVESMLDGENITEIRYKDYDDMSAPLKRTKVATIKEEPSAIEGETSKEVQTTTVTIKPHVETSMTTMPTTTPPFHLSSPPPSFSDKIKKNILSTIERNGNITDQILKKLDKNTEILQIFLNKLTEKIQMPIPKPIEPKEVIKFEDNAFPQWTNHGMHFNQNMVIRNNDSHISIPFVYAYQHPILPHKPNTPVANVVYHGHIHTNTIHPKDIPASAEKDKLKTVAKIPESNNQSRFFIDELENDYKVIQVGDVKKNRDSNMIASNGTLA